jgi:hypothetical protein
MGYKDASHHMSNALHIQFYIYECIFCSLKMNVLQIIKILVLGTFISSLEALD